MKISVLYVGASLLAPLKKAEAEIARLYKIDLQVATYNCGAAMAQAEWTAAQRDIAESAIVFIIHVTDDENAGLIASALKADSEKTVIAFNCMPDLMRLTHMGKLDFNTLMKSRNDEEQGEEASSQSLVRKLGSWMSDTFKGRKGKGDEATDGKPQAPSKGRRANHGQYVRLINKLPMILKFIPSAGRIRDIKNYLYLFCYFLQPTPNNIRSMLLYALKHYADGQGRVHSRAPLQAPNLFKKIKIDAPEQMPAVGIYHPEATKLFESFEAYQKWYESKRRKKLAPDKTVGLLLMRPQIISDARQHYDTLIRSIENQGLSVIPAISTFMDNREACRKFFIKQDSGFRIQDSKGNEGAYGRAPVQEAEGVYRQSAGNAEANESPLHPFIPSPLHPLTSSSPQSFITSSLHPQARVSQIVSLTGFSFVGGPAMNDSEASVEFFKELNVPFRSMVSLDVQTIENWQQSKLGINPVQAAMQVALPELDGATEAFVFGGLSQTGNQPVAIEERCQRIARRLAKWNHLQVTAPADKRLAFMLFCFPPNKGNIGTAADLDVFPSLLQILHQLQAEGYTLSVPEDANQLRQMILEGNADDFGALANVVYRLSADEYRRLCPYVSEIEKEWGTAPGNLNANGREVLISGVELGNVFIGIQPTFGYEGDPMRMLASESGSPHHGFMGLYTYVEKVFKADAVIHVGTHGSLEFMPGKQVGLSEACWPDRLIGELPNIYLYSVNNPSEGTIAKRRSYAELVSYLTPPIENAGLYKEFISMKELLTAYRQSTKESERQQLFAAIEEKAKALNL
jgi:magnesium chelatase subunit H